MNKTIMGKLIAKNPNARHNYTIEETIEAGIVLSGTEIKSIRAGKVNLKDSYAGIINGEVYVYSMHISPYEQGNILYWKIKQKGYSIVPMSLYFKGDKVKLELGIGKGKKLYDKRQDIAKKDAQMKIQRAKFGNGI